MDVSIILVLLIIAMTLILFVSDRIRIDVVAILATLALAWLGLVTPAEALSGFASNAVVAMAAVMILGHGIERTGIATWIANSIVRYTGNEETRVVAFTSLTAGLLSSVLQNIGAAALFLPAMRRLSRRTRTPVSRLIMPIGFATILGGCITMIGSGPLIVLNDLLRTADAAPFSIFDVTPVGIPLLVAGVLLFALAKEYLLPLGGWGEEGATVAEIWRIDQPIRSCIVPPSSSLAGKTREDAYFKFRYGLDLLAIWSLDEISIAPSRGTRLEAGQELAFIGSEEDFARFIRETGCISSGDRSRLKEILEGEGYGFAELVVRPRASIVGRTPREISFRQTFSVEPIVHVRGETETRADFSHIPLAAGDVIVAFGSWENLRLLANHRDLLLVTQPVGEIVRHGKAYLAILLFAASIALTFAGVPISLALLTGAAGMIVTGVLTIEDAYHAIDWKSIVLIAGLLPLGIAMEKSGAAVLLAVALAGALEGAHPLVVFFSFAIITTALTLVISNVAATVLLVPLAMLTGAGLGTDPRALALLVGVCASNSFILPTHQVNALLMGPGGYTTRDYLRAGGIMTLVFIAIAVTIIFFLIA
ncbi:MAG: SLC13 family permease [Methanomicrobiales archaeon]|nr:SLC13 family permease [Methanomicrobiales archaeon]